MANTYANIGGGGGTNVIATYWEAVSAASGTITIPQGATILLDMFQDLEDAVASKITSGLPNYNAATTAGSVRIVVGFDVAGAYTLDATPSSYPVAIVYRVLIMDNAIDYGSQNVIIEDIHRPGGGGSGSITDGSNLGTGAEVFKTVSGSLLTFRTLVGENVSIVEGADEIVITVNNYMPGGWA